MIVNFTPMSALIGGALIGLAASMLLVFNGRIAGISGIFGGLLRPQPGDVAWRASFVGGLLVGGVALLLVYPSAFAVSAERSVAMVAAAGLVVGLGVRMGNGCTSGHGVCGLTRFSPRSLVATLTFMATGFVTGSLLHLLGGAT